MCKLGFFAYLKPIRYGSWEVEVLFEESTVQELLAAAAEADLRAVEELLRRPLDPDVVDRRGKTALCASRHTHRQPF